MMIRIRLLAAYRRYLPEGTDAEAGYPCEVPPDATVGDVLAKLPIPHRDPYSFFVNGRHAERGQILKEGDLLSVFPAVGGG